MKKAILYRRHFSPRQVASGIRPGAADGVPEGRDRIAHLAAADHPRDY